MKKIIFMVFAVSFINVNAPAMGRKKIDESNTFSPEQTNQVNEKSADGEDDNRDIDSSSEGDFIYVEGDVTIKQPGSDKWEKVSGKTELIKGAEVKLEPDSYATVKIDSEKEFDLNEETRFKYSDKGESDEIDLFYGSMKAKVKNLSDEGMKIRTPVAVAAVRGTEFAVLYEEEESSEVEVYDGNVAVSAVGKESADEITVTKETWAKIKAGEKPSQKGKITETRKLRWRHLKVKREVFRNYRKLKRLQVTEARLEKKQKVIKDKKEKEKIDQILKGVTKNKKETAKTLKSNKEEIKKIASKYKEIRKKNVKSRIELINKKRKEIIEKRLKGRKEKLKERKDRQKKRR